MSKKATVSSFDPREIRKGLTKDHADHLAASVAEGRLTLEEAAEHRAQHVARNHSLINDGIRQLLGFLVHETKSPVDRAKTIAAEIEVAKLEGRIDQAIVTLELIRKTSAAIN
jgi:hypothetical protein